MKDIDEWIPKYMNEWMKEWKNEWMNEWINESIKWLINKYDRRKRGKMKKETD
jgi:predicted RNA-binding protein with EMAP domain